MCMDTMARMVVWVRVSWMIRVLGGRLPLEARACR